jgi:hypothetical protein
MAGSTGAGMNESPSLSAEPYTSSLRPAHVQCLIPWWQAREAGVTQRSGAHGLALVRGQHPQNPAASSMSQADNRAS